jgi:CheY-like chemotaxis protein
VRSVTRRILERAGYETIEAANGEDALALVEARGAGVALVITDLIMPEMRGTELARRLRERFPALKVLLVSGYTEDAVMRQRTFDAETAFLEKPFTPDALVRAVRKALE